MFYGVQPHDPVNLAEVALTLNTIALATSYIPPAAPRAPTISTQYATSEVALAPTTLTGAEPERERKTSALTVLIVSDQASPAGPPTVAVCTSSGGLEPAFGASMLKVSHTSSGMQYVDLVVDLI